MRVYVRLAVVCIFSSALLMCLTACGGGSSSSSTPPPATTKYYAVADYNNNRVLIYDAPFSTNQSASVVLGQADFTHGAATLPAPNTIYGPNTVAADSSGNLYVADQEHCRVLQFQPPFTNNMNASVVIGQASPTAHSCTASASTLGGVMGIAIDGSGNLWVSDVYSRIVEFVVPFSNGMTASLVIGQTSLTSTLGCNQNLAAPTASTLCSPWEMAFDASGNLWVADTDNYRVLEFKTPFSNGMAASLELGQPAATAFTSNQGNNGGLTATSLTQPLQPAFDASGNLWVVDLDNSRVLEYKPPFSNGMAASLELGQPSATPFTSGANTTSQSGLFYPYAISFDSSANMQVVDNNNNRVMIFEPPFSNGMNATSVLGQANFTTGTANQGGSIGANTLNNPYGGVAF